MLSRGAKIRRVMMAARRTGSLGERAGVIVDRSRPLVPASAIPEDLIAQAQVSYSNVRVEIVFYKEEIVSGRISRSLRLSVEPSVSSRSDHMVKVCLS